MHKTDNFRNCCFTSHNRGMNCPPLSGSAMPASSVSNIAARRMQSYFRTQSYLMLLIETDAVRRLIDEGNFALVVIGQGNFTILFLPERKFSFCPT